MVRITTRRTAVAAALGAAAMVSLAAPALADPMNPLPLPPDPVIAAPAAVAAVAPVPPIDTAVLPTDTAVQAAPVPHLSSIDNLPPGTSYTPPESGHRLSYLRDLWNAVQTQEVSGGDALLLLTQRPMDPDATSPNGLPSGPQPALPTPALPDPAA